MGLGYNALTFVPSKNEVKTFAPCFYNEGDKWGEHTSFNSITMEAVCKYLLNLREKVHIWWSSDYDTEDDLKKVHYYDFVNDSTKQKFMKPKKYKEKPWYDTHDNFRMYNLYIINNTKKEMVALWNYQFTTIHPLPCLTVVGGGDGYGTWCGDEIEVISSYSKRAEEIEKTYKHITPFI